MTEKKSYPILQSGDYLATLDAVYTTLKSTNAGDGTYLNARFQIAEGEFKGRGIFHKFHVTNKSTKCLSISAEQAEKFLKAVGEGNGLDALGNDMAGIKGYADKECVITVGVEAGRENPKGGNYPDRNVIKKWSKR